MQGSINNQAELVQSPDKHGLEVLADRFGCNAASKRDQLGCALYLWLLGDNASQLAVQCPCERLDRPSQNGLPRMDSMPNI